MTGGCPSWDDNGGMSLAAIADTAGFGRYRLVERIGAGGMAIVYRAFCDAADGTPRELVIKRVLPELSRDPSFSSMLVAEARISSRLTHPNIVQLYELGRVGDEYYLAMELVDGVDLVRLLNACVHGKRPLPLGLACRSSPRWRARSPTRTTCATTKGARCRSSIAT